MRQKAAGWRWKNGWAESEAAGLRHERAVGKAVHRRIPMKAAATGERRPSPATGVFRCPLDRSNRDRGPPESLRSAHQIFAIGSDPAATSDRLRDRQAD